MRHPIVCGIDGSKESCLAARVAAELARTLGRGLVLAHATDDPPTFPYGDARLRELQRRSATHAANRLVEDVAAALPTIGLETRIMFGDPGEALDALCRDREASCWSSAPGVAHRCARASRLVSPAQANARSSRYRLMPRSAS